MFIYWKHPPRLALLKSQKTLINFLKFITDTKTKHFAERLLMAASNFRFMVKQYLIIDISDKNNQYLRLRETQKALPLPI